MAHLAVMLITLALVVATVVVHYEVLRGVSGLIPRLAIPPRSRILVVIAGAFLAHLAEIGLYAGAYLWMERIEGLGRIVGMREGGPLDYFYFSTANFTTLGIGDLAPEGPMRIVAGIESLNGLVLISWSASFTYLSMEKFWQDHR